MLTSEQQTTFLNDLFDLIRIPSISALSEHKQDILKAADFITNYLINIGFKPENIQHLYTDDNKEKYHPVVCATRIDDPTNKTIVIYGHYDVQPVDPIEEWKNNPFEPEIRNGSIYARGATDDKGQLFTHLAALKIMSEKWGDKWPVNFKFIIEGEEEMGGENIELLVNNYAESDIFKGDICLVSDGSAVAMDKPTIGYGCRGLTYMQIDVRYSGKDMHSGIFGNAVLNPANTLVEIISKLRDNQTGKVLVPGFYDDVLPISAEEKEAIARVPFSEEEFLSNAGGAFAAKPEEGFTILEATTARPSLDINGIWGGFQGEGAKTVIPAEAHAKISMRLVANQEPEKVAKLFEAYVKEIAPKEVEVNVIYLHGGFGYVVDLNSKYVELAKQAMEETYGNPVVFSRSGGSIPILATFKNKLGLDNLSLEYGLPDDGLHAPNEKYDVECFYKGIECNTKLYELIAKNE